MEKEKRKHLRIKGYDYSFPGFYYVTICTKLRDNDFGEIRDGIMGLSEEGLIAYDCWRQIPDHFEDVTLDDFVIMPDHVHGIIEIEPLNKEKSNLLTPMNRNRGEACLAPIPIHIGGGKDVEKNLSARYQKIPTIIGSFKSAVTKKINLMYDVPIFKWQRSYWCEIVNHEDRLNRIRKYIQQNPAKWEQNKNSFKRE